MVAMKNVLLAAEEDNGDTIRVSAPAPIANTIVSRKASAVAPVAVNEMVDKVAKQKIVKNITILVAEASATGA